MFLKIPAVFSCEYLDKVVILNDKYSNNGAIVETYGSLPSSVIGSTRDSSILPAIDYTTLEKYIKYSEKHGITFNYAMNSLWQGGGEFTHKGISEISKEIKLLYECGVKSFTVGSVFIMKLLKSIFPDIELVASINMCISSVHELERMKDLGVDKVNINRFYNRDFSLLKNLISNSDLKLELLLNSLCNLFCSMYILHNMKSTSQKDKTSTIDFEFPLMQCIHNHTTNMQSLVCAGWIRPDDLHHYIATGYNYFKMDGRGLDECVLLKHAEIYLSKKYDGNFFDYFDFFNTGKYKKLKLDYQMNNRDFDGFLEPFIAEKNICRNCKGDHPHCSKFAEKIEVKDKRNLKHYERMVKMKFDEYNLSI